jgi:hypothetical protein
MSFKMPDKKTIITVVLAGAAGAFAAAKASCVKDAVSPAAVTAPVTSDAAPTDSATTPDEPGK